MNREEAKELLPIIKAFSEGRKIECRTCKEADNWDEVETPNFSAHFDYRIKPEPKYRPFKDAEECWNEMQKHQPFGWMKDSFGYTFVAGIEKTATTLYAVTAIRSINVELMFKDYTFADGAPFGVKVEED